MPHDLDEEAEKAYELGANARSLSILKDILKKDERNLAGHFYIALVYLRLGRLDEALKHAKIVQINNPREANIHLNLGCIYEKKGELLKAMEHYKKELEYNTSCNEALSNLGMLLFERNEWALAIPYLEKSYSIDHCAQEVAIKLAQSYNKLDLLSEEIALYQKHIRSDPKNIWALQNLGAAMIDKGDYASAIALLQRAKELDSNDEIVIRNLQRATEGMQGIADFNSSD